MLSNKQITILGCFLVQPYKEQRCSEVKHYTKGHSNSVVQAALAAFVKENEVTKRLIGRTPVYKPDPANPLTLAYFQILLKERLSKVVRLCLNTIIEELADIPFTSVVIFGSYVISAHTEKSDLDIAVFVRTPEEKKECASALHSAENKCPLSLDAHVITQAEMKEMLAANYENLGKQIAVKHLAVHNPELFYILLQDGIKHGFQIVYGESRK